MFPSVLYKVGTTRGVGNKPVYTKPRLDTCGRGLSIVGGV